VSGQGRYRDGFAVIDKEPGCTSHDVVAQSRRLLGIRKVGHAGTLDPDATGVLILGVGPATRLLRYVTALGKTYEATVVFGAATDTCDAAGSVVETWDMSDLTEARARAAAAAFVGEIQQIPPMVSAVRVDGRRLHELAREGLTVAREPRTVRVESLELTGFSAGDRPRATVTLTCSSGTYVRTLAADWGAAPVSPLLRWWWGLWIVARWGLDTVDLVASFRLDEAGFETVDAATNLVEHALDIPLAFVLVAIITAVTQLQSAHHHRQTEP